LVIRSSNSSAVILLVLPAVIDSSGFFEKVMGSVRKKKG